MLDRLSVNSLLQSAIALMACCVVVMLAQRSWDSYARLASASCLKLRTRQIIPSRISSSQKILPSAWPPCSSA